MTDLKFSLKEIDMYKYVKIYMKNTLTKKYIVIPVKMPGYNMITEFSLKSDMTLKDIKKRICDFLEKQENELQFFLDDNELNDASDVIPIDALEFSNTCYIEVKIKTNNQNKKGLSGYLDDEDDIISDNRNMINLSDDEDDDTFDSDRNFILRMKNNNLDKNNNNKDSKENKDLGMNKENNNLVKSRNNKNKDEIFSSFRKLNVPDKIIEKYYNECKGNYAEMFNQIIIKNKEKNNLLNKDNKDTLNYIMKQSDCKDTDLIVDMFNNCDGNVEETIEKLKSLSSASIYKYSNKEDNVDSIIL